MNKNISLKKENQEQTGNKIKIKNKKKEASSLTTAQKEDWHSGGSYSQYQNFQGSITRFEGSKKINKIQSLLLSTISAIIQSKGLVKNVTKSPSIKSHGPISLLFPDIEHIYNFCL